MLTGPRRRVLFRDGRTAKRVGTSRAQDPQLHTHVLVCNVGLRRDGTTGALESKPLFEHKMAAGALYRAELAHGLERALGVEMKRVRSWFEIEGVAEAVNEHFSTRRREIEREPCERERSRTGRTGHPVGEEARSKRPSV